MAGIQHLVDGQADRPLERETHHRLRGPVEEQDVPLRVQEDHAVFQLVDHPLQVGLLAERQQPVRLQLASQARELGGELLELVTALGQRRGLERLAPPDPVDLPHDGADRPHRELRQHHRGQPGQGQRDRGHRQALLERPGDLAPQERRGDAQTNGPEEPVVERHRQHRLVGAARGVERGEAAQRVQLQEPVEVRAVRLRLAFLLPLGVEQHGTGVVGDERVDQVRRVSDAGVEEAAQLRILPERGERIGAGRALQRAAGLGVDLLGDELGLLHRLLHHHAAELGEVDGGGGGDHEQREQADDQRLPAPDPESQPHASCRRS